MSLPTTGAMLGATLLASTGLYGLASPEIDATPPGQRVATQAQVVIASAALPHGLAGIAPVAVTPLAKPAPIEQAQPEDERLAAASDEDMVKPQGPAAKARPRPPSAPVQRLIEPKVIEQKMMGQPMPAPGAMPPVAQPMMQPRMPMANAAPTAPVTTQVHGFDGIIASERQLLQRTSSTAAYEAHIASVGNMPEAEKLWQDLAGRLGGSFGGISAHFKVIDVPQHGSFVRLMAGDFADASQTADFCRAVIAAGRDCRILRKLAPSG